LRSPVICLLDSQPTLAAIAASPEGHFHPQGKAPSKFTQEVLRSARAALPFDSIHPSMHRIARLNMNYGL